MNRAAAERFEIEPRSSDPVAAPTLRVALDVTPLLGARTGIGAVTQALVDGLCRNDTVDVTGYVVSWKARNKHQAALPPNCEPYRLRWPARACHHLWRYIDRPSMPKGFDVVHGTNYSLPPAAEAVGLVAVHDLTAWRYPELVDRYSRANPQLLRRALARGAQIHTGTNAVADELAAELGVDRGRIHVVVNGFDRPESGDGVRGRNRIGAPYVLAIGTIEPRKDYVGLVRAMTDVWDVHPDLCLAIVGGDGWGTEAFEAAVAESKAGDRIVRCGYVSDAVKADLLAGAELLAFPSVYEGFGLPVLEAMHVGLPVVSTTVPAIAEVAGGAAILVPPRSPEDLARAITVVLEDQQLRSDLINRGFAQAANFTWDQAVEDFLALYRLLLG